MTENLADKASGIAAMIIMMIVFCVAVATIVVPVIYFDTEVWEIPIGPLTEAQTYSLEEGKPSSHIWPVTIICNPTCDPLPTRYPYTAEIKTRHLDKNRIWPFLDSLGIQYRK